MQPGVTAGLGKGFQVGFQLPIDLKVSRINYSLLNGDDFTPPYGDLHHRDEELFALGDARVMAHWRGAIPGTPLLLGFSLGAALPTGKTEDNPFTASELELWHQHLQFGNGTVDPIVAMQLIVQGEQLGLLVQASTRIPVYANSKGYQGSKSINVSAGPTLRLPDKLKTIQLSLVGEFEWLSPELWDDLPGKNSGVVAAALRLGASWNPIPKLAIQTNLLTRVFEHSVGAQFSRPITLTVGVSGFVDLRKLKKAHKH
jgi:hypothetical protein